MVTKFVYDIYVLYLTNEAFKVQRGEYERM